RVVAGMERKAARGEWTAGNVPYGYRLDDDRRYLTPDPAEAPVVALIFERYTERHEGSAALAHWLTERGYRTRRGKAFNPKAVLGILRNRVYLGEIFFRGVHHPGPHEPLIDHELFERAAAILRERGEDATLRRSNNSDYLLTGLVRCARCGKRYLGAAAHGNGGRYAYYVCFSRQRYGCAGCDADRLPADKLEDAILAQLASVLGDQPLVREAIVRAHAELDSERPRREAERERIDADLKRANDALDRYFHAFENRTLSEQACGKRIDELTRKIAGLEARREELTLDDDDEPEPPSDDDLGALQAQVGDVIRNGDPPKRSCSPSSTRSGSSVARRCTRSSLYPRFDHRPL
ncbi:MAG: recombinase family protein, partial [Thermoleophilaceae bacterium]